MSYDHKDFWMPMDTNREYELLNKLWKKKSKKFPLNFYKNKKVLITGANGFKVLVINNAPKSWCES